MAEHEVDKLSLDINIQGAEKKTATNIIAIATAIEKLNESVGNSGALNNLKAYSENLQSLAVSIRGAFGDINKTAAGQMQPTITPQMIEVDDNVQSEGQLPKVRRDAAKATKDLTKEQKKLNNALKDEDKPIKKSVSGWSKFTKSIGRIAMYRAIRSVIKSITQAMVEGVQNYAKYSESANKAISNIRNSFQQIKDSFGVTLGYLLEAFEPVITAISDGVVQLADNINMALAAMSGKSTYSKAIKQNEDYAKSLDKVNNKLLSFDKFESLNKDSQDNGPRYEEVELGDKLPETASMFKSLFEILQEVFGIIKDLAGALKPLLTVCINMLGKILPIIKTIVGWLGKTISVLDDIGLLEPILWGIVGALAAVAAAQLIVALTNPFTLIVMAITAVITAIVALVQNWDKVVNAFKKGAEAIKNAFVAVFNFIKNLYDKTIGKVVEGVKNVVGGISNFFGKVGGGIKNIFGFANGGIPQTGTMFYAGEAGAEIVSTSRGGQTGVANVEQISQAFLQALINYNAAQNGQNNGGNVYIDGRKVGQVVEGSVYNEGVRVGHFSRI